MTPSQLRVVPLPCSWPLNVRMAAPLSGMKALVLTLKPPGEAWLLPTKTVRTFSPAELKTETVSCIGIGTGVGEKVGLWVKLRVCVTLGVAVREGVAVRLEVELGVAEDVTEAVRLEVAVGVKLKVEVMLEVGVMLRLGV